jgi:mannosyl-glycoprotein endo-beta-N-acetylglucosaminidase
MKGGYLEDRIGQIGPHNPTRRDVYNFSNWNLIDIFVYFSHCRVTIPPPSWTNAAHRNGVLCLGTLITEWDEGLADLVSVFSPNDKSNDGQGIFNVADKLIELAVYYGFDGWLINIECKVRGPSDAKLLADFTAYLTKGMKKAIPHSKTLWYLTLCICFGVAESCCRYDSVTIDGELRWQSALTEKNQLFFESADGIFLDYHWVPPKIKDSVNRAKSRAKDVFVGLAPDA